MRVNGWTQMPWTHASIPTQWTRSLHVPRPLRRPSPPRQQLKSNLSPLPHVGSPPVRPPTHHHLSNIATRRTHRTVPHRPTRPVSQRGRMQANHNNKPGHLPCSPCILPHPVHESDNAGERTKKKRKHVTFPPSRQAGKASLLRCSGTCRRAK